MAHERICSFAVETDCNDASVERRSSDRDGEEPNPPWMLPPQDGHLMPQADQLELQRAAPTKPEGEDGYDDGQNRDQACDATAVSPKSLDFLLGNSEF